MRSETLRTCYGAHAGAADSASPRVLRVGPIGVEGKEPALEIVCHDLREADLRTEPRRSEVCLTALKIPKAPKPSKAFKITHKSP